MQGQNFFAEHGIEYPVRQVDAKLGHAVGVAASDDLPAVDETETFACAFIVCLDVGFNASAAESVEGCFKLFVAPSVCPAIGSDQQIVGFEMQALAWFASGIHFGDQLADAINENIFVVDGRQAQGTRGNGNRRAVVFVYADTRIRLGRQAVDRMLHGAHVVFQARFGDIADKEIVDRIAIRQKRRFVFRVFTHHRVDIRAFTHACQVFRVFTHTGTLYFVLLPTPFRAFTHGLSCFYPHPVLN